MNNLPNFNARYNAILEQYNKISNRQNRKILPGNGIFERYTYPILTSDHIPIAWKYDLNPASNPYFMERFGINAVFNAGAIKLNGKYLLINRVEGVDRKSFFAIAESSDGINNFKFWDYPITIPETADTTTNVYDMRIVQHEDGWIYGIFCAERKDPDAPSGDLSSAIASAGVVRTHDLISWERLPDIKSTSQQRNVVLHPEFINGKYALYTRPQEGFIDTGKGGGIGWSLIDSMDNAIIKEEQIINHRYYHTIKEAKNGEGPAPIKTAKGWLHLAHGVRNCASGLRYVLYLYLTDLKEPNRIIAEPAGYFMAPIGEERVGDVSNVLFSNGWITDEDGTVYIYYASSDTRMHVATSSIDRLLDYCLNTGSDEFTSSSSVNRLNKLIRRNQDYKSQRS